MRQCFKNIPAKFQSRPTFLAGFFSKTVTDDDGRLKAFFVASRGEDNSLMGSIHQNGDRLREPKVGDTRRPEAGPGSRR